MKVETRLYGFDALDRRLELAIGRMRAKMTQMISHHSHLLQINAKKNAPVDSGELRRSIKRMQKGMEAMVYSDAEHAAPIEFGADPHEIRPNSAGALHFFWQKIGREVFFGQVDHPGNKAQRFMRRAINETWPQLRKSAKRIMKNVL